MSTIFVFGFFIFANTSYGFEVPDRCIRQNEDPVHCTSAQCTSNKATALAPPLSEIQVVRALSGTQSRQDADQKIQAVSFPLQKEKHTDSPYVDAGAPLPSCQTVRGYGFAVTGSTVINYEKLPSEQRQAVMENFFSKEKGAAFTYVVLPVSSTDFNNPDEANYSVCDCHGKSPNRNTSCFDPTYLHSQVEFLKEATRINPELKVMLKSWSPPPHMKKIGTFMISDGYAGGDFDQDWSDSLAGCLSDAVKWISAQGIRVQSVAPQNEPGIKMPYPSVYMDETSQAQVLDGISNRLAKLYPDLQYVLRSDNFNSAPSVKRTHELLNSKKKNLVFAAHCYGGVPSDSNAMLPPGQSAFCGGKQSVEYMLGECTGHDDVSPYDFPWWMENRIMLDSWMGATGTVSWNGVLDEQNGPKAKGCPKCRGLVTTDFSQKPAKLTWNPEYHALRQISQYVRDGAKKLVTEQKNAAGVSQLFFENPNGQRVGVFWNPSDTAKKFRVITEDCSEAEVRIEANSALSLQWSK